MPTDHEKPSKDLNEIKPVTEGVEGYDDSLDYTEAEEAKVRRQIDLRLMPWVLFSTFILNMDRTNISNAISGGLPRSLGFNNTVINNAGSLYAVVFSLAAFFGSILGKKYGPHRFIPFLVLSWGIVTLGHGFVRDTPQFYLIRFLIALTEGGVIPATIVYLGSFYKRDEIATRLSWFWGVQSVASAVSGLMASGLLQLEGVNGLNGWRWLFIVDGIITIIAAGLLWFALPSSPYHTKGGLNVGGWLDERQASIGVTRVVRDDLLKLHYNTPVQWSDIVAALKDYKVWGHLAITCVGLTHFVPYGTYLPSIINSFGYNVYVSNALTAPSYILGFITMTIMTSHSDKVGERGYHGVFAYIWFIVGFAMLEFLPDNAPKAVFYFATLIISSAPLAHPMNIAWLTENTAPIGKRTVASGLVISAANIYGIYANQIYQPSDAPRYHVGNFIILGFLAATVLLFLNQKFLYARLNKQRANEWNAKSDSEKEDYNSTTTHQGSDRLDFVFKL
ncbi:MFS general substrate transporter [Obelidium mucronatum]|nr:MFS general substrate transporter [Obelidium mucronatum]